jgi:hypothetical protein
MDFPLSRPTIAKVLLLCVVYVLRYDQIPHCILISFHLIKIMPFRLIQFYKLINPSLQIFLIRCKVLQKM